jgi:hypothetical protein
MDQVSTVQSKCNGVESDRLTHAVKITFNHRNRDDAVSGVIRSNLCDDPDRFACQLLIVVSERERERERAVAEPNQMRFSVVKNNSDRRDSEHVLFPCCQKRCLSKKSVEPDYRDRLTTGTALHTAHDPFVMTT